MRSMVIHCVAAAAVLMTAGCSGIPSGEATPTPRPTMTLPDFDGDGSADTVAGLGESQGRVVVQYGVARDQQIRRSALDGEESASFGASILAHDLNDDGLTDLVVGDPGPDADPTVWLIPGSKDGLDLAAATTVAAPSGVGGFGSALAVVAGAIPRLAVGAPHDTKAAPGGTVVLWQLGSDGKPEGTPTLLTQKKAGIAEKARAGDSFGASLASSGHWLAVGAPRKDVSGVRDAGVVAAVNLSRPDTPVGVELGLGLAGTPGAPEAEARFGLSLAAGSTGDQAFLVVGAPLQDAGGPNTGSIQIYTLTDDAVTSDRAMSAASLGDGITDGGLFGFDLAMARPCEGVPGVVVGMPGAPAGTTPGAGAAWLIPLIAQGGCTPQKLVVGGAIQGEPSEGAQMGRAVAALNGGSGGPDSLLLAAPGNAEEGVGSVVLVVRPPYRGYERVAVSGIRLSEEGVITLSPTMP